MIVIAARPRIAARSSPFPNGAVHPNPTKVTAGSDGAGEGAPPTKLYRRRGQGVDPPSRPGESVAQQPIAECGRSTPLRAQEQRMDQPELGLIEYNDTELRLNPSRDGRPITSLARGDSVEVLVRSTGAGFTRIRTPEGLEGWVSTVAVRFGRAGNITASVSPGSAREPEEEAPAAALGTILNANLEPAAKTRNDPFGPRGSRPGSPPGGLPSGPASPSQSAPRRRRSESASILLGNGSYPVLETLGAIHKFVAWSLIVVSVVAGVVAWATIGGIEGGAVFLAIAVFGSSVPILMLERVEMTQVILDIERNTRAMAGALRDRDEP